MIKIDMRVMATTVALALMAAGLLHCESDDTKFIDTYPDAAADGAKDGTVSEGGGSDASNDAAAADSGAGDTGSEASAMDSSGDAGGQ
jgi:hypothetical protein